MHSMILKYLRQTRSYNLNTGDITIYMSGICKTRKILFLFGSHAFFRKASSLSTLSLEKTPIEGKLQQKFLREVLGTRDNKE